MSDPDLKICKVCKEPYSKKEARRVFGDHFVSFGDYCSSGCYTQDVLALKDKPDVETKDRYLVMLDGDKWFAGFADDFIDLQMSPSGWGDSPLEAIKELELCKLYYTTDPEKEMEGAKNA